METCNGSVEATHEADIYVHDFEMFPPVLVVPSTTPALISVGKLLQTDEIVFSWPTSGPVLTKPDGAVVKCQLGINVPIIAAAKAPTKKEKCISGIATGATACTSTTTIGGSGSSADNMEIDVATCTLTK